MNFSFPKSLRIRKRKQYRSLRHGKRLLGLYLDCRYIFSPRSNSPTRLGITVRKKFGNAVARNRFKRCLREAFRLLHPKLPQAYSIELRPLPSLKTVDMSSLKKDLEGIFSRV